MGAKKGTNLEKNPFKEAMNSSISNAAEIMNFVVAALNSQKSTDSRINDLLIYVKKRSDPFQQSVVQHESDEVSKVATTATVVVTVKGMTAAYKRWKKAIANVYDEGSDEYNNLLIGGTKSFYTGSRAKRKIRVDALINTIGSDAALTAVKADAQLYSDTLGDATAGQSAGKTNVGNDSSNADVLRDECTKALWYAYAGLLMVFIDTPSQALKFFPMQFIYNAANQKSIKMPVPAHVIKKILSHLFKTGETATMTNNGIVPLNVGLALTSKSPILMWFVLLPGETKTVTPDLLGNILFKFVMVENLDLLISGNITFTVNKVV